MLIASFGGKWEVMRLRNLRRSIHWPRVPLNLRINPVCVRASRRRRINQLLTRKLADFVTNTSVTQKMHARILRLMVGGAWTKQ